VKKQLGFLMIVAVVFCFFCGCVNQSQQKIQVKDQTLNTSNIPIDLSTIPETNLTEAQKKLSTDLLQLIGIINLPKGITQDTLEQQMKQNHQLKWVDETGVSSNGTIRHKLVYVYITTNENADQNLIKANIWNITNSDTSFNIIVAWVDTDNLQNLAMIDSIKSIRTVIPPMTALQTEYS
jgi:hypothetical protein